MLETFHLRAPRPAGTHPARAQSERPPTRARPIQLHVSPLGPQRGSGGRGLLSLRAPLLPRRRLAAGLGACALDSPRAPVCWPPLPALPRVCSLPFYPDGLSRAAGSRGSCGDAGLAGRGPHGPPAQRGTWTWSPRGSGAGAAEAQRPSPRGRVDGGWMVEEPMVAPRPTPQARGGGRGPTRGAGPGVAARRRRGGARSGPPTLCLCNL